MYPIVKRVKPIDNYNLILTYENGELRQFDMKPFLNKGIFKELYDVSKFNSVKVSFDTIEWENEADLDPEVLYEQSICINGQL
ncbi:MAG: DUF2442 domain-containing protein [Prolixibacteraceae bacterium]